MQGRVAIEHEGLSFVLHLSHNKAGTKENESHGIRNPLHSESCCTHLLRVLVSTSHPVPRPEPIGSIKIHELNEHCRHLHKLQGKFHATTCRSAAAAKSYSLMLSSAKRIAASSKMLTSRGKLSTMPRFSENARRIAVDACVSYRCGSHQMVSKNDIWTSRRLPPGLFLTLGRRGSHEHRTLRVSRTGADADLASFSFGGKPISTIRPSGNSTPGGA